MKPEELRIGNLVQMIIVKEPIRVKRIDPKSIHLDTIEPIPLTEEWLLKFGFKNDDGDIQQDFSLYLDIKGRIKITFYQGDSSCLSLYQDDKLIDFPVGVCKNAHQLQNLYFALTGTELTIN